MANKITQREYYNMAIEVAKGADRPDLVTFFEERIAVLDKKSANRKPTKAQEATVAFREAIVEVLTNAEAPLTTAEIKAQVPGLEDATPQRITGLITPLIKTEDNPTGVVERTKDKKVTYYSIA